MDRDQRMRDVSEKPTRKIVAPKAVHKPRAAHRPRAIDALIGKDQPANSSNRNPMVNKLLFPLTFASSSPRRYVHMAIPPLLMKVHQAYHCSSLLFPPPRRRLRRFYPLDFLKICNFQ